MSLFSFGFKKEVTPKKNADGNDKKSSVKKEPLLKSLVEQSGSSKVKSNLSVPAKPNFDMVEDDDELLSQMCELVESQSKSKLKNEGKRVNGHLTKKTALESPKSPPKSARPTRSRAAKNKKKVVDSSEDEDEKGGSMGDEEDEEFEFDMEKGLGSKTTSSSTKKAKKDEDNFVVEDDDDDDEEMESLVDESDYAEEEDGRSGKKTPKKILKRKKPSSSPQKESKKQTPSKRSKSSTPIVSPQPSSAPSSPIHIQTPDSPKPGLQAVGDHEHHHLPWLQTDKIRDKQKRKKLDPTYDPTSLHVPKGYIEGSSEFHDPNGKSRKITPSMCFWWGFKEDYFDTILFYKVGKFYEIYHMDADVAVKHLGLIYMKGEVAHCGFPEKAYGKFSEQLVELGYRVARVEQTETPAAAKERTGKSSAPVRREICAVISRGTRTLDVRDGSFEQSDASTCLLSIFETPQNDEGYTEFGVCILDPTTGKFSIGTFKDTPNRIKLRMLLAREDPAELAFSRAQLSDSTWALIKEVCPYVPGVRNTVVHTPVQDIENNAKAEAKRTVAQLRDKKNAYFGSADEDSDDDDGDEENVRMKSRSSDESDNIPLQQLPTLLQEMLAKTKSGEEGYHSALAALGVCVRVLKRNKIDRKLISMNAFDLYQLPGEDFDRELTAAKERAARREEDPLMGEKVVLDGQALSNLELFNSSIAEKPGDEDGSLLSYLDHCKTKFGKRELRRWLAAPLQSSKEIRSRQAKVAALIELIQDGETVTNIRNSLKAVPDMERMLQRIHSIGVKDLDHPDSRAVLYDFADYNKTKINSLVLTLRGAGTILKLLDELKQKVEVHRDSGKMGCLKPIWDVPFAEWTKKLERIMNSFDQEAARRNGSITPRRGASAKFDGACAKVEQIKESFDEELERVRGLFKGSSKGKAVSNIKFWHPSTGKDLFQIVVPDELLPKNGDAPAGLLLKSKTKTFRRYHTKTIVSRLVKLAEAEAKLESLKADATRLVFEEFDKQRDIWTALVDSTKELDVLISLAIVSGNGTEESPMCVPEIIDAGPDQHPLMELKDSRHPCVARMLEKSGSTFIPNDVEIGGNGQASCMLLTGPNMGGKSTLLRQVCIATIMAQIGCYVCASSARISPVDRVFTRLGASDAIMAGKSTFFVELDETATILHHATERSLVILDELGRGTSTHDGSAIAAAVVDKIIKVGARTLFATHYHALVEDFANCVAVKTAHMACYASNDNTSAGSSAAFDVTFLYKLADGASDKSHGLNVARLAKLPDQIIQRANEESVRFEQNFLAQQIFNELEQALENGSSSETLEVLWTRAKALGL